MRKNKSTLSQLHFEELYKENSDPWNFGTSEYDAKRYAKIMESLTHDSYGHVLEIGCSIGVLTELLAKRSDKLLAIDIVEQALKSARTRLVGQDNVTIKKAAIPDGFPSGTYDLVVVSEVGHYLGLRDLVETKNQIKSSLELGGELILVHSTHHVENNPLSGNQVHEVFTRDEAFTVTNSFKNDDYRLDVLRKK